MADDDAPAPEPLPVVKPAVEMDDETFKKHWSLRHPNHALDWSQPHGHKTPESLMRAARSFHTHVHDNRARYRADLNHTHRKA